jgi:UDP:flavonoid glycosyltransferase YjiC (YdhE family)
MKMAGKQESSNKNQSLTILFIPYASHGPMNQCIGMGDILRRQGHRIVIVIDPSWKNKLTPLGLEEYIIDISNSSTKDVEQRPGEYWTNYVRDALPKFRQPPNIQLETYVRPTWHAMLEEAKLYDQRLRPILDHVRPDIIVQDTVVCFPIVAASGVPYVRVVSCNPLEMPGEDIPPAYSGLPQGDKSRWNEFRAKYDRLLRPLWEEFSAWVQSQGAPPLPDLQFIYNSEHANIYIYP